MSDPDPNVEELKTDFRVELHQLLKRYVGMENNSVTRASILEMAEAKLADFVKRIPSTKDAEITIDEKRSVSEGKIVATLRLWPAMPVVIEDCLDDAIDGVEGDPVRQCAREIADHVRWKAPEQIDGAVAESLWDMTQALGVDPTSIRLAMQQISREVHNTSKDFNDVDAVERRLRLALGGDDADG